MVQVGNIPPRLERGAMRRNALHQFHGVHGADMQQVRRQARKSGGSL
jgi:hypothetical protein